MRNVTFTSKRAQVRIERILKELRWGALSAADLAEKVHCDHSMVTAYLAHLMDEPRRVRIESHEVINGCKRPLYGIGNGPDAPLTVQTNVEKWLKVKADPVKYAKSLESRKQSYRRRRALVPPEQRQRCRRVYDPPLPVQVEELLNKRAGYTVEQITTALDASEKSVMKAVRTLVKEGKVRRAVHSKNKAFQYETPNNPMPKPLDIPKTKQGIFAALGL